ncbi:hypothetical protein RhiirA4_489208 [Rhizophagus irregularis]|uniref:Uncharacterized protein n=1 Tax=Rhizophagus irregularis TaxID=588596 RepID=A0A2I1HUP4_9GLOM|nr:hypothetical protein RhiirA4_489208 [Rhizophagus irregularis]
MKFHFHEWIRFTDIKKGGFPKYILQPHYYKKEESKTIVGYIDTVYSDVIYFYFTLSLIKFISILSLILRIIKENRHQNYGLELYGITKDSETKEFMITMVFVYKGNLRNIL